MKLKKNTHTHIDAHAREYDTKSGGSTNKKNGSRGHPHNKAIKHGSKQTTVQNIFTLITGMIDNLRGTWKV